MTQQANPRFELKIERMMDAPPAKLWRCWTEPALMEQWFCPKPWRVSDVRLDLKPGGEFFCVMNGPDGERFENPGVYLAIEPERRIVTTDAFKPGWVPADRAFMTAEVTFEDVGGGKTRYVARAMHWSEEAMKEHEAMGFHEGWGKVADQLEELAKSL